MHFTYPKGEKKTRREKTERKEKNNNNNSQPNENVNDEKKIKIHYTLYQPAGTGNVIATTL